MGSSELKYFRVGSCVGGVLVASYFVYLTQIVGVCVGHCDVLYQILGLAWFSIGLTPLRTRALLAWSVAGIVGVTYFEVLQALTYYCPFCTVLHVFGLIAALLALMEVRSCESSSTLKLPRRG